MLRVVKGDATPEEVAALVAVIAALGSGPAEDKPKPRSTWADPAHRMRTTLSPTAPAPGAPPACRHRRCVQGTARPPPIA